MDLRGATSDISEKRYAKLGDIKPEMVMMLLQASLKGDPSNYKQFWLNLPPQYRQKISMDYYDHNSRLTMTRDVPFGLLNVIFLHVAVKSNRLPEKWTALINKRPILARIFAGFVGLGFMGIFSFSQSLKSIQPKLVELYEMSQSGLIPEAAQYSNEWEKKLVKPSDHGYNYSPVREPSSTHDYAQLPARESSRPHTYQEQPHAYNEQSILRPDQDERERRKDNYADPGFIMSGTPVGRSTNFMESSEFEDTQPKSSGSKSSGSKNTYGDVGFS